MEPSNQFKTQEIRSKFDLAISSQEISKVYIEAQNNEYWNFYFQSGYLIWATSSKHRVRRLYRTIQSNCPSVNCQEIKLREKEVSELWGFLVISILHKRKQISLENLKQIIEEIAVEVLFDLFQASSEIKVIEHFFEGSANPKAVVLKGSLLKKPLVKLNAREIYSQSEKQWDTWLKADFAAYSPNLALVIENGDGLESVTSNSTYLKLSLLVDGKRTLRELAVTTKQDILTLLRSFSSYVEQGYLDFVKVEDAYIISASSTFEKTTQSTSPQSVKSRPSSRIVKSEQPLIVCIDDSPMVCDQICRMVNNVGFSFIGIQESIQALTILLEHKPDLIFLDLVMPVTNGYELCSQIRRISLFRDTPIIILTGNDGVIDRVRSKMAGATEFIAKPIDKTKIFSLIYKYCDSKSLTGKA